MKCWLLLDSRGWKASALWGGASSGRGFPQALPPAVRWGRGAMAPKLGECPLGLPAQSLLAGRRLAGSHVWRAWLLGLLGSASCVRGPAACFCQ